MITEDIKSVFFNDKEIKREKRESLIMFQNRVESWKNYYGIDFTIKEKIVKEKIVKEKIVKEKVVKENVKPIRKNKKCKNIIEINLHFEEEDIEVFDKLSKISLDKVYNESCVKTMQRMPDNYIDLVVTSPPYDNLREYEKKSEWTWGLFTQIAQLLYDKMKEGGIIAWVVNDASIEYNESGTSFSQALYFKSIGFKLLDTVIYQKSKMLATHNRLSQEFEYIFILLKGDKPNVFNPLYSTKVLKKPSSQRGKKDGSVTKIELNSNEHSIIGNVWFIAQGTSCTKDKIAYKHPAIYPEEIPKRLIFLFSNKGNIIYDPFGGSGTTAKIAILMQRRFILSEINENYVKNIILPRIKEYYDLESVNEKLFEDNIINDKVIIDEKIRNKKIFTKTRDIVKTEKIDFNKKDNTMSLFDDN